MYPNIIFASFLSIYTSSSLILALPNETAAAATWDSDYSPIPYSQIEHYSRPELVSYNELYGIPPGTNESMVSSIKTLLKDIVGNKDFPEIIRKRNEERLYRLFEAIHQVDLQSEIMMFVLQVLKGNYLCKKWLLKMKQCSYNSDLVLSQVLRNYDTKNLELLLEVGYNFSLVHQDVLKDLFQQGDRGRNDEVIDIIIRNNVCIPGAEEEALCFLLNDNYILERYKLVYFVKTILKTLSPEKRRHEIINLALRKKKFRWVHLMLLHGWEKEFTEKELRLIYASRNWDLIDMFPKRSFKVFEGRRFKKSTIGLLP